MLKHIRYILSFITLYVGIIAAVVGILYAIAIKPIIIATILFIVMLLGLGFIVNIILKEKGVSW